MITNSEEANKYYQLVNQFIDEYTDTHKIKPSRLGNYLKNNQKLVRFMERRMALWIFLFAMPLLMLKHR